MAENLLRIFGLFQEKMIQIYFAKIKIIIKIIKKYFDLFLVALKILMGDNYKTKYGYHRRSDY